MPSAPGEWPRSSPRSADRSRPASSSSVSPPSDPTRSDDSSRRRDMTGEPRWPLVRYAHHFGEIDSTSDQAKRMLVDGSIEAPALVWADRQTRGRGQGSNDWWSDAGSLTATVVLDPSDLGLA